MMFELYCSAKEDLLVGQTYIKLLKSAFSVVSPAFNNFPETIELNILSPKEWADQPFGKSQPYGSPVVPDHRIYISQKIDQGLLTAFNIIQKKLDLTPIPLTSEEFGLLLIHEMGHILLKNDVPREFFQSEVFKQINESQFEFLGEFHAQLVLANYLQTISTPTIWDKLGALCYAQKDVFEKEYGKISDFGQNYGELVQNDSGAGIYYFQLLFLQIAQFMYSSNQFIENPLKLFMKEFREIESFDDIQNSQLFNYILNVGLK